MKPMLMILGLILAAGAGAVGGILAAPRAKSTTADAFGDARPAAIAPNSDLDKRLQSLNLEISGLQTEIAALREDRGRVSAAVEASKSAEKLALANQSTEVFAATHREAVLKIVADERAAQEKRREDERKERELKNFEAKADRAAQKLGMSGAQRQTLVDYYVAERTHIEEMRAQFRDGAQQDGGTTPARDAFREGREWRANELTRLFGTDLGAQINEFETEGMRARAAGGSQRRGGGGADAQNAGAPTPAPAGGNR